MCSGSTPHYFFKVGGALEPDVPSYVQRPADGELLHLVRKGEYCNLLTARQMGKSSLIVRAAAQLEADGVRVALIDLVRLGTNITSHEWYLGLLRLIRQEMSLELDEMEWWKAQGKSSPVQRFYEFTREQILARTERPIVIFIDEIDSTLTLPFTDDFFAAIRSLYNERAINPDYRRLTFVLVGVVRPADLIEDRRLTPYNIGRTVELRDFAPEEAKAMLPGLERVHQERSESVLEHILHWTDGHPYLTQKLCAALPASRESQDGKKQVDALVAKLFFHPGAIKGELNLQPVEEYILENPYCGDMLRVYRRILEGRWVKDEERSPEVSHLKLSGLVKATPKGCLQVRNRVYNQVFDADWAEKSMPGLFRRVFDLWRRRR
jgi:hypothetical protein